MAKHLVHLYPSDKKYQLDSERSLLQGLKEQGVFVASSCGGQASCTDCKIKIMKGDTLPPERKETELLGNIFHLTQERLACQVYPIGPLTIDLSEHIEEEYQARLESKGRKIVRRKKNELKKEDEEAQANEDQFRESGFQRPKKKKA